jgi:asparagine synthase (glutamine-hydrolysing)
MSAIAGIEIPGKQQEVQQMLDMMGHRGPAGSEISEINDATLGVAWTENQSSAGAMLQEAGIATDFVADSHFATVYSKPDGFFFKRDPLGIAPLYYGKTPEGALAFASEVKALVSYASDIQELSPGSTFDGHSEKSYFDLQKNGHDPVQGDSDTIARELRAKLERSVESRVSNGPVGVWLSGDSIPVPWQPWRALFSIAFTRLLPGWKVRLTCIMPKWSQSISALNTMKSSSIWTSCWMLCQR